MKDQEYFDRLDELAEKVMLRLSGDFGDPAMLAVQSYRVAREMLEQSLFERKQGQLSSQRLLQLNGNYREVGGAW